ncbi:hypothetical protein JCM15765_18680 [Paradesulfitobacterium aromaticivorans]
MAEQKRRSVWNEDPISLKFTSLAHLINADLLRTCHLEMDGKKATGVDGVTKEAYAENLEENLEDLVARMKREAYRPQPVRRVYIPKPGSDKLRPLGIPSKIIAFGRYAAQTAQHKDVAGNDRKGGKPETFDFLGFTHYCSIGANGRFRVKRKTSRKKFRASLLRIKLWIQKNRHLPKDEIIKMLGRKLRGHYQYYGITDNSEMLSNFLDEVKRHLFKNLNRRSQKSSYTWDKFVLFLKRYPLPRPKIYFNVFEKRANVRQLLSMVE